MFAVPELHSPVVGAVVKVPPFDEPHCPLIGSAPLLAKHEAVVPPFEPTQVHIHLDPLKYGLVDVPELHNPLTGASTNVPPLDDPHCPLTGSAPLVAKQLAVVPPFEPTQVQIHLDPLTYGLVDVPELHSPVVGAELKVPPFDEPHCPFIGEAALLA